MMYQDRLAVAIKSDGKVLREFGDTVYLPFGTEFSLFIKNMNSLRAMVRVEIDGTDVLDGDTLVVHANDSIDLERFLKGGNTEKGNRFKFIERTAGVEKHRGIKTEDGLIRVEFEFERAPKPIEIPKPIWGSTPYFTPTWSGPYTATNLVGQGQVGNSKIRSLDKTFDDASETFAATANTLSSTYNPTSIQEDFWFARSAAAKGTSLINHVVNDAGITVPGSVSEQKFFTVSGFETDGVKHVLIFKLLGQTEANKIVVKPVTVKAKPKCSTCGRQNKATNKFCSECGTSLELI